MFLAEKRIKFMLDNYYAHLPKEVEISLNDKGYFLFVIGGGITGDLQVNDTVHCHRLESVIGNREIGFTENDSATCYKVINRVYNFIFREIN